MHLCLGLGSLYDRLCFKLQLLICFVVQVVVLPGRSPHRRRRSSEPWLQLLIFTPLLHLLWLRLSMVVMISRKPSLVCCSEDQGSGEDCDCVPRVNVEHLHLLHAVTLTWAIYKLLIGCPMVWLVEETSTCWCWEIPGRPSRNCWNLWRDVHLSG